jgi:hypothetical protein
VEKYGDLITNGLDLISFLLVTPELVRFAQPVAQWTSRMVFSILAIVAMTVVLLPVGYVYVSIKHIRISPTLLIYAMLAAGVVTFLLGDYPGNIWVSGRIQRFTATVSRHLFALGVTLFFISRLVAFYGSALKAGFL